MNKIVQAFVHLLTEENKELTLITETYNEQVTLHRYVREYLEERNIVPVRLDSELIEVPYVGTLKFKVASEDLQNIRPEECMVYSSFDIDTLIGIKANRFKADKESSYGFEVTQCLATT